MCTISLNYGNMDSLFVAVAVTSTEPGWFIVMWFYGFKLSTKYPSEIINNSEIYRNS